MLAEEWWEGLTKREQFILTQMLVALGNDRNAESVVQFTRERADLFYPVKRKKKPATTRDAGDGEVR